MKIGPNGAVFYMLSKAASKAAIMSASSATMAQAPDRAAWAAAPACRPV